MIEILVDVILKGPYNKSLCTLFDLASLRNIKILSSSSNKGIVEALFPLKTFKLFYNRNPKIMEYPPPVGSDKFIENIIVKKIIGK